MQIAIDVLARILLLHGRVQAAFYRPRAKKDVTAIRNQYEFKPFTFGHADALHYHSENHSSMSQSTEYIVQIDEKLRKLETLIVQNGDRTCEEVEHDYRIARTQWRNVAIVMDRLFFVMYLITLIVTFVLLFPRPVTPPQTWSELSVSLDSSNALKGIIVLLRYFKWRPLWICDIFSHFYLYIYTQYGVKFAVFCLIHSL